MLDEAHERQSQHGFASGSSLANYPLTQEAEGGGKSSFLAETRDYVCHPQGDRLPKPDLVHPIAPIIHVHARQYPVGVHFAKKTEMEDYVGAAYKKVVQIHKRLPEGGVLVFLTGQQEIETLCKRLREK